MGGSNLPPKSNLVKHLHVLSADFTRMSNAVESVGSRCKVTSEDKIDEIRRHIEKFPAETSHYSRGKNPNRR